MTERHQLHLTVTMYPTPVHDWVCHECPWHQRIDLSTGERLIVGRGDPGVLHDGVSGPVGLTVVSVEPTIDGEKLAREVSEYLEGR